MPNKPMVPTAATAPTANPPRPLRRHIGQPLDGAQSREPRMNTTLPTVCNPAAQVPSGSWILPERKSRHQRHRSLLK